ncbi:MAG TPA: TonB-dependent receptor [Terriglobales bacterium]|nr:TonB-dependent receptor [Terriglobales bacterium]
MRKLFSLALLLISPFAALAADFTVHVTDPTGSNVAAATVNLYQPDNNAQIASATTNGSGNAVFHKVPSRSYRVQVLAPGFAASLTDSTPQNDAILEIHLKVAARTETVVVTATETPLPADETGAPVESVDRETLINRQPIEAADAIRYLPGAIVNTAGRRGGIASLFVRGGDSRYNKVIIDGVPVDEPGGTFDFGAVPVIGADRIEFVRGPESVLYGSDALTSVVQMFSATGTSPTPELTFGADGGTFSTAHGYAKLAGAHGRFDYNLFGEQFNTAGQGINDDYSNSAEGANVGVRLTPSALFRFRTRHSNARSGVQSFFNFNGQQLIPPDSDQFARQNNFLADADLELTTPRQWKGSISGYDYHHRRLNQDTFIDPGRVSPFGSIDFPFSTFADQNRAGFMLHGEYDPRLWARTNFGYEYENENGFIGDLTALPLTHGLRRNHAVYGEQIFTWSRVSLIGGARFVHNESFGNRGIPRAALTFLALRGGNFFSGTRLRFAYGEGIKEPSFDESFGIGSFQIIANPNLKPEESRTIEGAIVQGFEGDRYSVSAGYYNNRFRNQIEFTSDPVTFVGQFVNLNRSLAHGAELEFHGRPWTQWTMEASYVYTSSQILQSPIATDPLLAAGAPLLRRPKHAGSATINYFSRRWGANLSAVGIGRRTDSDFLDLANPPINHAAGYVRADAGGWYQLQEHVTAYIAIENLLNKRYEEAAGYPALGANFRAGLRFRIGGER